MVVDAQGVLVASGCLSPIAFYPHRWLASCVQHREKESRVSVSPCQWIASRQQVLCSAFSWRQVLQGAMRPRYWICKGDFCTTQRWNRWKRRKLPTAVKVEEVVQDFYDPTVDQVKEEKTPTAVTADDVAQVIFCPNGWSGGRGEDSQRQWRRRTYMSIYDPAEEEKASNGCEGEWGHI